MEIHQHIYETPEILRSMILSTVSCLQSDNDVSTSNSPPARNIVMIYPDYYIETCVSIYQNTTEFFFTQIWKTKMLHLEKHSNPLHISETHPWPLNQKPYSALSIDHFESNFVNPDKYESENKQKKIEKIENQKIKHYLREKSHQIRHYLPVNFKLPLR